MTEEALRKLDYAWSGAYLIFSGEGAYSATRRDNGRTLTDESVQGLRTKVTNDFDAQPVPRDAFAEDEL
jgi:hypothetical protein